MSLMQKPHGRNKGDCPSSLSFGQTAVLHFTDRIYDIHDLFEGVGFGRKFSGLDLTDVVADTGADG